jgi:indolepyruvate ferredoxin oxidoreductase, alpha subunit
VVKEGLRKFLRAHRPDLLQEAPAAGRASVAKQALAGQVHGRPPSFCTGCPERPIFAAIKLVERELGPHHVSCDIGCHLFSILPPFNIGNSTMGYGLGGAGAAVLNASRAKRAIALVGDGGFWHNGLASSVGNAVFNKNDNVMIVVTMAIRPRPAARIFCRPPPPISAARPAIRSRRLFAASASSGCARSRAPMISPGCATR